MGKIFVLGTSCAVPGENNENTHLALAGRGPGYILVDSAGQTVLRLRRAGLDYNHMTDLVLTHFHPDHVYGAGMLLMEMWLRGRQAPLAVHALAHCRERFERQMADYGCESWPGLFPITYHSVEEQPGAAVLENADFTITAAPVKHFIPTLGLRVIERQTGRVLAYSCDTEPCPGDFWLAQNADLLVHEAAGLGMGHSSAAQAGEVARQSGARRLALIHYCTDGLDTASLVPEAEAAFGGPVVLTQDFMTLDW